MRSGKYVRFIRMLCRSALKNRRHMMQYETIQMKENQIADQKSNGII